jgi:hypothetical protein
MNFKRWQWLMAVVIAAVLFLPPSGSAQAKAWHSPSGGSTLWSIDPICRNGVKIQLISQFGGPTFSESRNFTAHYVVSTQSAPEPLLLDGDPPLGKIYGQVQVTARYGLVPRTYDNEGTPVTVNVYGEGSLRWEIPDQRNLLAVGTPVVVKRSEVSTGNGPYRYFFGTVKDCYISF